MKIKPVEILELVVFGPLILAFAAGFVALPFVIFFAEGWLGLVGWAWGVALLAWAFLASR